jgi:hypothetical protein
MKLFTYILKINLGLPELKWALFCYLMKVFSVENLLQTLEIQSDIFRFGLAA